MILAALAKTAANGFTAADMADALAADLKDDLLDAQDGTTSPATAITSYIPTNLAAAYQTIAAELADAAGVLFIAQNPLTVKGSSTSNPSTPTTPTDPTTPTVSDAALARAFFAELRTTLSAVTNHSQTGFVDTQIDSIGADFKANVAPSLSRVADQVSALASSVSAYDAAFVSAVGFSSGTNPLTGAATQIRYRGNKDVATYGNGTYDVCWTDEATLNASSEILCLHTSAKATDWLNRTITQTLYTITSSGSGEYGYNATAYTQPFTYSSNGTFSYGTPVPTTGNIFTGEVGKTVTSGVITSLTLVGTLPPTDAALAASTIALNVVRSEPGADVTHYALSGTLDSTNASDNSMGVRFIIGDGSQFDIQESDSVGNKLLGATLVGTARTSATKFVGTLTASEFGQDADASNYAPTKLSFNGALTDLTSSSELLNGTLIASVSDYAAYHVSAGETDVNYLHAGLTFDGSITVPSRPVLSLSVAAAKTGLTTTSVVVGYAYDGIVINGAGFYNSAATSTNTLTLNNQAGIVVDFNLAAQTATVTKSGSTVATVRNGAITYIDGVTESVK